MTKEELMMLGVEKATETMLKGIGGPFGAVVVKDGEVISVASNSVLRDNDPTAHAEINAIREACKKLGTYDLTGCELYATGYPCPMCLSAIIWANIRKIYTSGTVEDAARIGFRDDFIYNFIRSYDDNVLKIEQLDDSPALKMYDWYETVGNVVY